MTEHRSKMTPEFEARLREDAERRSEDDFPKSNEVCAAEGLLDLADDLGELVKQINTDSSPGELATQLDLLIAKYQDAIVSAGEVLHARS